MNSISKPGIVNAHVVSIAIKKRTFKFRSYNHVYVVFVQASEERRISASVLGFIITDAQCPVSLTGSRGYRRDRWIAGVCWTGFSSGRLASACCLCLLLYFSDSCNCTAHLTHLLTVVRLRKLGIHLPDNMQFSTLVTQCVLWSL